MDMTMTGHKSPFCFKNILVVDDTLSDRKLLSRIVTKTIEARVIEASSGIEALTLIQDNNIDLVLLDFNMFQMSGTDVVQAVREKANLSELPIIIVSGNYSNSAIVECLGAGANDYITKPIQAEIAVNRIVNQLKLSDAVRAQVKLMELQSVKAMVVSYNHEINNPLTAASLKLELLKKTYPNERGLDDLSKFINRISQVIKQSTKVTETNSITYEDYSHSQKMVKLK